MRLELTARHFTIPAPVRKLAEQRLARVLRPLNDGAVSAQIVVTREKTRFHAEVTLHARGEHFLHGEATGRDAQTALGASIDKVERQVLKLKSKWTERKRQGISPAKAASATPRPERGAAVFGTGLEQRDNGAQPLRIIRARRYAVKPMSIDEAAIEVADGRDAFLVFRNSSTEEINVLFRRADGNLGLIEPEA
ncbi:MAG TPA: ribosome-associated translation inhibitor RaiA [Vicinamibacterales bacterium]|jgi:putative sigma-54 modulation protein|nr:ribosome-associated translation inhibitor RaiA [Vicinamibacterales bacterium]